MSNTCKTDQGPETVKERIRTWVFWKPLVFTAIGGLGGFLYFFYIGCASGSCGITSNPYASIAFGGFMGYFFVSRPCAC